MFIDVVLTLADLRRLVSEMAPLRIHLDETDRGRWVTLDEPSDVVLIPERGAQVTCSGMIRYDVAGAHPHLRLREVRVMLEPRLVEDDEGLGTLSCFVTVEHADVALIPPGLDTAIVAAVNKRLTPSATHMVWHIERKMHGSARFPDRLEPLEFFKVGTRAHSLDISESVVRLRLEVDATIERSSQPLLDLPDPAELTSAGSVGGDDLPRSE